MARVEGEISQEDRRRILASATDYIESWLDGDAERMTRCLHVDLAKRSVDPDPATGGCIVDPLTRDQMIAATREGRGTKYERPFEVSLLDAFEDIATVRVFSSVYMDYLHLSRCGSEWLLINVLWQRRPGR